MHLLNISFIDLPFENPVLIFALLLFIILFAPILLNKVKIPPIIGLIVAGAIIGPFGFNLILRDSSIILFGTVGLLYIMYLSGLDTDINEFKKNLWKSMVFSFFTFVIPMVFGTVSSLYILELPILSSVLLASMYASNTLITYPMVGKFGISKNSAVNVAVSGTLVTTVLALLVLALIVGITQGEITSKFWIKISVSLLVFVIVILFLFPIITRWFFKRFNDNISQYIFVLGMIYIAAFLAEVAGIDKIVGAFMAGLAMNSLIQRTSPLMNRIVFVGNALFIPFFLIGVGMLINYRAFISDRETIIVAITMTIVATLSKYMAALITQKLVGFNRNERGILFGLTNAQAASTLAAVLVGYNIIVGEDASGQPIRLLSESILNGTILMILITCTIASFATQHFGQKIANTEATALEDNDKHDERILVTVNNPETIDELINLGITIKTLKNINLYALNIIAGMQASIENEKVARDNLTKAAIVAAATDNKLTELLRYDQNVVSGITNVVKEHKITDIVMGLHHKKGISDNFLGTISEGILSRCNVTTFIYKPFQPMSTIKRHVVLIPKHAERVIGFFFWLNRLYNIAYNSKASIIFYATQNTLDAISSHHPKNKTEVELNLFNDWSNIPDIALDMKDDDNLIVVLSRKNHISYNPTMNRMHHLLNNYFSDNSFILIYPVQRGVIGSFSSLSKEDLQNPVAENKIESFEDIGESIERFFLKKH